MFKELARDRGLRWLSVFNRDLVEEWNGRVLAPQPQVPSSSPCDFMREMERVRIGDGPILAWASWGGLWQAAVAIVV